MMDEDSWTKRITFSTLEMNSHTSKVKPVCFLCGCYPFQGASDITVHSIAICNDLGRSDEGKGGNTCSDESGGSEHGLDKPQHAGTALSKARSIGGRDAHDSS